MSKQLLVVPLLYVGSSDRFISIRDSLDAHVCVCVCSTIYLSICVHTIVSVCLVFASLYNVHVVLHSFAYN